MTDFHEGTRSGFPSDACPLCLKPCLAADVKAMGKRRFKWCLTCRAVFQNGEKVGDIEVYEPPIASG